MITNHTTLCFGFVENNVDPLKIGRVQVRLIGYHTNDENKIPSENLPWCQSIVPPNLDVVKPPAIGSQVICISLDETFQNILVLGIINGISDDTEEPDTPRVARNENITDTIVQEKSEERLWKEPNSYDNYNTSYPKNTVYQTDGGHTIEIDDTAGFERVNIYHESGSYIEMTSLGDIIVHGKKNSYDINELHKYTYTGGDEKKKVNGSFEVDTPMAIFEGDLRVKSAATGTFATYSGTTVTVQDGIIIDIS